MRQQRIPRASDFVKRHITAKRDVPSFLNVRRRGDDKSARLHRRHNTRGDEIEKDSDLNDPALPLQRRMPEDLMAEPEPVPPSCTTCPQALIIARRKTQQLRVMCARRRERKGLYKEGDKQLFQRFTSSTEKERKVRVRKQQRSRFGGFRKGSLTV